MFGVSNRSKFNIRSSCRKKKKVIDCSRCRFLLPESFKTFLSPRKVSTLPYHSDASYINVKKRLDFLSSVFQFPVEMALLSKTRAHHELCARYPISNRVLRARRVIDNVTQTKIYYIKSPRHNFIFCQSTINKWRISWYSPAVACPSCPAAKFIAVVLEIRLASKLVSLFFFLYSPHSNIRQANGVRQAAISFKSGCLMEFFDLCFTW